MKYEKTKKLADEDFRRLTVVKRKTFDKIACSKKNKAIYGGCRAFKNDLAYPPHLLSINPYLTLIRSSFLSIGREIISKNAAVAAA